MQQFGGSTRSGRGRSLWSWAVSMALVVGSMTVLQAASPPAQAADPPGDAALRPNLDNWSPGDVHVHAAGDSGLGGHARCAGLDEEECATKLVRQTMDRARANDLDWMIYTEHVPWLGLYRRTFCSPFEAACQTVVNPLRWEHDQALRQFEAIRDAATNEARARGDVRLLMGEELGTAAASSVISGAVGYECDYAKPGHFGAYYVPRMVSNGAFDCDEVDFLKDLEDGGAWGAVNHPDNGDHGSDWHCYNEGDDRQLNLSSDLTRTVNCPEGAADFGTSDDAGLNATNDHAIVFRNYEIVNDDHLPTSTTLDHLDQLLTDGWRVAVTGGSDSHTVARGSLGASQSAGNDGKIGLKGRTYADVPGGTRPDGAFRSDSGRDPVRRALREGRTVASNGPLAVAQVNGGHPGDRARFTGTSVNVRVDWPLDTFPVLASGNGEISPSTPAPRIDFPHTPDQVVVVLGKVFNSKCDPDGRACAPVANRHAFQPSPDDRARGWMNVTVPVPAGWDDAFVRVESLKGPSVFKTEFPDNYKFTYGAYTSPILLERGVTNGGPNPSQGCRQSVLPRNDDGSTGAVQLPFAPNFFGTTYTSAYVNNNGNITFRSPLGTYTPFRLNASTPPIIAPFFADVDTRGAASHEVTYGATQVDGRLAFCVYWEDVGYYPEQTDKLNTFRLYLIDRSDVGPGNFDILFDYDSVKWETGSASGGAGGFGGTSAGAGFSSGTGEPNGFFELPGSLVNGAFLDSSPTGLANTSSNSLETGVHRFEVRNGGASGTLRLGGRVVASASGGTPVAGALVEVCPAAGGRCPFVTVSDSAGAFTAFGLPAGTYNVRAFPPPHTSLSIGAVNGVQVAAGSTPFVEVVLPSAFAAPNGVVLDGARYTDNGAFSTGLNVPLSLVVPGCPGANSAVLTVTNNSGSTVRTATLTEQPSGYYRATLAPFTTAGALHFSVHLDCPGTTPDEDIDFTVYIDPSGNVVGLNGAPIENAIVTLMRSETENGPFEVVEDGSAVMSPSNRANPDATDAAGRFAWDVIAGYYRVRAEAVGCHAPGDPGRSYVETDVLQVPPPALDLILTLDCTPPTAAAVRVITTQIDGEQPPIDYTADCTAPGGTPIALGPVSVPEGPGVDIGTVAVGSSCVVHQPLVPGLRALAGSDLDVVVGVTGGEVRFVNSANAVAASLTVSATALDPALTGTSVQLEVSCGGVTTTETVLVGSSASRGGLAQGDSCTVNVPSGQVLAGAESSSYSVVMAGGENLLAVPFEAADTQTWPFTGFYSPVDNLPVLNRLRAGQAVPVKFSLGGDRGLAVFAEGSPSSVRIDCDTNTVVDQLEETVAAGGSSLSYDSAANQYIYVWRTAKTWAGQCRRLDLRLADGTTRSANFLIAR